MFKNYLKMAFRNMRKHRLYAIVNIIGFATGIAACMLIALFIRNQLSFDKQIAHHDRVYRIIGQVNQSGIITRACEFPAPMSKALQHDFPEIEKAGRLMPNKLFGGSANQVRRVDQANDSYEEGFCFADPSILDILDIHLIYGNREYALSEPNTIVMCKSMADKYFPNQDPVGKMMIFNDNTQRPLKIGGVMADFPATSHLQYKCFISLSGLSFWNGEQETWNASNYAIYLLLKPGVNIASFNQKITRDVLDKYMMPSWKASGRPAMEIEKFLKSASLYLQNVTDIHLGSYNMEDDYVKHGDIRYIWMFAAVALFILLLACINFINLSTARATDRAKEVGIRKVIGSLRADLVKQFMIESLLYSFLSFIIAFILAYSLLPLFNKIVGMQQLTIPWRAWWLFPLVALSVFVIGLFAGLYPAFYLSYFNPVDVLKGKLGLRNKNGGLRNGLVIFQFAISVVLMIGTMVIYKQMQYILHSKIGFNKEEVVMIKGTDALGHQTASFKNELLHLPDVENVSVSDFLPVDGTKRNGNPFWIEGQVQEKQSVGGQRWVIDENYIPTLGMKLIAGRNFSKDMPTDSQAAIINQAMVNKLGLKDPIGKIITNGSEHLHIIGVVGNFYFQSVKQQVEPLCMVLGNSNSMISVKLKTADMHGALDAIGRVWKRFEPHQTLRYDFLDQRYAAMYADVELAGKLFTGFSLLAIIVACLGLFALSAFMVEQRHKEIGIRKVLGATAAGLFTMMTGNFLKLICIALLIAMPVGWFVMNKWLQNFAYRIHISWWVFIIAGALAVFIALITVSFQAIKAAVANPVEALRSE
jgi:putative ABC transport system permease protein